MQAHARCTRSLRFAHLRRPSPSPRLAGSYLGSTASDNTGSPLEPSSTAPNSNTSNIMNASPHVHSFEVRLGLWRVRGAQHS